MKLIRYEIQKLTGTRFLWAVIAILFCINGAFAIYITVCSGGQAYDVSHAAMTHREDTQRIIDAAYQNIREYAVAGIAEDAYAVHYQRQLATQYERAQREVRFTETTVRGWNLYFTDYAVNIFLFFAVMTVGAAVFSGDFANGFLSIMRTTRRGRLHSAAAKTAVWILCAACLTIAFTAESFLIYGMASGYSDPRNAVQLLDGYGACPYLLTFGTYFLLSFLYRLLAMLCMTAFCVLLSQWIRHTVVLYLCGTGFLGINLLLYALRVYTTDNLAKHLNLIAVSFAAPLVKRYNAVNLLHHVVEFPVLVCMVYALLLAAAVTASLLLYGLRAEERMGVPKRIFAGHKDKAAAFLHRTGGRKRTYPRSLLMAEQRKSLTVWIVLCLLFVVKCYGAYVAYQPNPTFTDAAYHGYMTKLQGPLTEEKRAWITDERAYMDDTLARSGEMDTAYQNLEISREEYETYRQQREYAVSRGELFRTIEKHVEYIEKMEQNGREAWFLYDTGWTTLIFSNFDWNLYAVIVLICVGSFAMEYDSRSSEGGFVQILRTTKHGRCRTFAAKLLAACVLTTAFTVVWNLVELLFAYRSFDLPLWNAPVHSVETLGSYPYDASIGEYLLCLYGVRIIAAVLLSVFVCSLSALMKRYGNTWIITGIVTLLPAVLSKIGLPLFSHLDYTRFLQGTDVMLHGPRYMAFLAGVVILDGMVVWLAKRKWER